MKCAICKHGKTDKGHTTITLERNGKMIIFKMVPAKVCDNCGEAFVDDAVTRQLLEAAEESARLGVQVSIREFMSVMA